MTDEQIVKALECCANWESDKSCEDCPANTYGFGCANKRAKYSLDLINRQKAEIELKTMDVESLTNERNALEEMVAEQKAEIEKLKFPKFFVENTLSEKEISEMLKMGRVGVIPHIGYSIKRIDEDGIKAEAIKEFAERLKKYRWFTVSDKLHIDNLVAEMTESNKLQQEI